MNAIDRALEIVGEIEELGLKVEACIEIQNDALIELDDGTEIWLFDPQLNLEPCIEFGHLVYFTDGGTDAAVSIVNAVEAARCNVTS